MTVTVLRGIPLWERFITPTTSNTSAVEYGPSIRFESLPTSPPMRRKKPAPSDMIWVGEDYAKSEFRELYNCYLRRTSLGPGTAVLESCSSSDLFGFNSPRYPAAPPNQLNRAISKLRADVVNLGTLLGEYRQTQRLFTRTVKKLKSAYALASRGWVAAAVAELRDMAAPEVGKRSKPKRARNKWHATAATATSGGRNSASNAWLQYHLGIEQLAKDLNKALGELQGRIEHPLPVVKARVSAVTTRVGVEKLSNGQLLNVDAYHKMVWVAYAQIDNAQLQSMSDHGLTSLPSLVWELTPRSYMVDHFIKVGEWLSAIDFVGKVTRSVVYTTSKKRCLMFGSVVGNAGLGANVQIQSPPTYRFYGRETSRTLGALAPTGPRYTLSPSAIQILTDLASLRQIQRSMFK